MMAYLVISSISLADKSSLQRRTEMEFIFRVP